MYIMENLYFPEPIKLPSSSPILKTHLKSVAIPTMDLAVSGTYCISHECTCMHSTESVLGDCLCPCTTFVV